MVMSDKESKEEVLKLRQDLRKLCGEGLVT